MRNFVFVVEKKMCVERFPHTANKSKQINNEKHYFECRISLLAD